jgi:alkaline phosphatase D
MKNNRPPTEGLQFFGALKIKGSEVVNVSLMDLAGKRLFEVDLEARR